jgi:signal peptidase I
MDPELAERLVRVRDEEAKKATSRRRLWIERGILLPLLLLAVLAYFSVGRVTVQGISMEPTLRTGQTFFYLKPFALFAPLKPGDVVVLKPRRGTQEGTDLIKRVVFIQNERGNAPFPATVVTTQGTIPFAQLFPKEASKERGGARLGIYVLGDNLERSIDSREFGPVFASEVLGKVVL